MDFQILIQKIAVWALPVLFAITLREVAHGWVARYCGDDTAARANRLSLNPIRHIDPFGTIILPILLVVLQTGFVFGWAKPVPVNFGRLRRPRLDTILVAVAGPLTNGLMAIAWAVLLKLALTQHAEAGLWLGISAMASAGVMINLLLMVLNLLPLPPLDGGRVLVALLPARMGQALSRIEPWGMLILIALFYLRVLGPVLYWPMAILEGLLFGVLGINSLALF